MNTFLEYWVLMASKSLVSISYFNFYLLYFVWIYRNYHTNTILYLVQVNSDVTFNFGPKYI